MSHRKVFREFEIRPAQKDLPMTLVTAHVDPKWQDIVINGYGVKRKDAKSFRDWLTQALRHSK